MEDSENNKENIPSSHPNGFGRPSYSSGDSSMYTALGTFNAEQRQKELKLLAEEDFVAHLTSVRKNLQDQNEELRKKAADLRLKHQVSEAEYQTIKSKKDSVQKEIQENETTLAEMQERLTKKHMLIDKLKTAREEKLRQFSILMQRRQEFYDAVFEESPEGQMFAQLKQEVKRSQEILKKRQLNLNKLESTLKLKLKEQKEHWEQFKKKCVQFAEYFVHKKQDLSEVTWKKSASVVEKFSSGVSSGWNELYQMTVPVKKQRLMAPFIRPLKASAALQSLQRTRFIAAEENAQSQNEALAREAKNDDRCFRQGSVPVAQPLTPSAAPQQISFIGSEERKAQSQNEVLASEIKDDEGFGHPHSVPSASSLMASAAPQQTSTIASEEREAQAQNEAVTREAMDDDGFLRPRPVPLVQPLAPSATRPQQTDQTPFIVFEERKTQSQNQALAREAKENDGFFPSRPVPLVQPLTSSGASQQTPSIAA